MNKFTAPCLLLLLFLTACASNSGTTFLSSINYSPEMQKFADDMDRIAKKGGSINPYLDSSAMAIEGIEEGEAGVMEYTFEQTQRTYVPPDQRCHFALLVKKETEKIQGWKYKGKPEYCVK